MCGRKITSCLFAAHFFADDTANAEFILARKRGIVKGRPPISAMADLQAIGFFFYQSLVSNPLGAVTPFGYFLTVDRAQHSFKSLRNG